MELDERKLKILKAIISNYLETGEPVGSRTISKYTDLNLSSATIRNEMADLEELGLIMQPHTSAGRVPTDQGYRLYVDHMMAEKDNEMQEMKTQLLERVDKMESMLYEYLEMAIDIAKYHHENWDGTGYPKGLSGTDIPLSARIVAVIDTYMALNSDRSYRGAYTREESLSIMRSEAGKRFDPSIIDIFCKIQKQLQCGD